MNQSKTYIGAFLIAIAVVIFWALALPAYDHIGTLGTALQERQLLLDGRTAVLADLATLEKQYSERSVQVQRFASIVPAAKGAPELVSAVQAMASQSGLALTSFSLAADNQSGATPYNIQTIDMGLIGSYPALRSFLEAVESNLRLIDVTTIDANPTSDSSVNIGFRLKANAYYLK